MTAQLFAFIEDELRRVLARHEAFMLRVDKEYSMPFRSKAQMRAAFSGALGPEMKSKAKTWAKETPNIKRLPEKVRAKSHKAPKKG